MERIDHILNKNQHFELVFKQIYSMNDKFVIWCIDGLWCWRMRKKVNHIKTITRKFTHLFVL